MEQKNDLPFSPEEMALMMTMAYHTMEVLIQHDAIENVLQPEKGLTQELFDQVFMKLNAMRLVAQIAAAVGGDLVPTPDDDDAGDSGDPNDLANMEPGGNA